ncbi:MAG: MFS transporter [Streptosporangiales bacterium]|nr:MFS transporter [Streptosporangiales bacterium]
MTPTSAQITSPRTSGKRRWIGLAVLALPALLASLELTVTNLALPSIGRDLTVGSTQLLWIVDVYAFFLAGSLITMGAWGDRIGRRRILLVGAAAYGVTSVLAAYAVNAEMLIATRALMGVAGATLMPSTLSLTATLFPEPRQRATAVGVIVASVSGGTALGPLVGGWLLERFWWGSAFLLSVPVMAVLLVLAPVLLPEHRDPAVRRLDVVSALLSLVTVLPIVYGLKRVAAEGVGPTSALGIAVGLASGAAFVRRQRRLAEPFVRLELFAHRGFATAAGTLALGIFVLWGSNYAIAQYLQLVEGLSPLHAGLWTAPSAVGVIVGSTLAPRIARVVDPPLVIGVGLLLAALGYGVLTQVSGANGLIVLVTGAIVVSLGLGPMMALATDMVIGAAPPEQAGAAAAISTTAPQLGGALGIAVIGSVITAVYRRSTAGSVPGDAPEAVVDAMRDNLGAAVTAIARLTGPLATELLDVARDAFTTGFHVAAGISAVLMAGTAVVVLMLRRDGSGRA